MKRLVVLLGGLLGMGGLAWLGLAWFIARPAYRPAPTEQEFARSAAALHREAGATAQSAAAPPLPAGRVVRLAVGGLGCDDEPQDREVGDLLMAELTGVKGLELVDRQSLGRVLRELELNLSGLVRAKDAVRAGGLLRADWFLLGTVAGTTRTNRTLVARVVDARTGIMREVGVFTAGQESSALAAQLADFVRGVRARASAPKLRTFLGVGTFADVGVNQRQAEFPQQLRAYLTRSYQGTDFTWLEREQVNTLLQEVRLDLAGLTADTGTNAQQPLQSAVWLINGFYQSFETTGYEVEVTLQVNRAFGGSTNFTLRGPPNEAFFRRIKRAIDTTIGQASPRMFAPTRRSEAWQQLRMGKDLLQVVTPNFLFRHGYGGTDAAKRRAYLTEAARAFETVLLLEPDNREAKFNLSSCYCDFTMDRENEGLGYLRELASASAPDGWAEQARLSLGWYYQDSDPRQAAKWFNEAAAHATNSRAATNFQNLARQTLAYELGREGAARPGANVGSQSLSVMEEQMLAEVASAHDVLQGKSGVINCSYGLEHYVEGFGTDTGAAARRLVELLPGLRQRFPDMAPHLLCAVASFQVDTNAPVVMEFRQSLRACAEHPEQVLGSSLYFKNLLCYPYEWCFRHKDYALAAELVESKRQAAAHWPAVDFTEQDKVRLAFAYLRLQRWRDALSQLEGLGDTSITMAADGPWGKAWTPVLPARVAAFCRSKLGLTQPLNAGHFTLGQPCLALHTPSVFTATPDGLWVALGNELLRLDFELRTNRLIHLPLPDDASIMALCVGPEHIWVGTEGYGLLQYEKSAGRCRVFTERDGLLLDSVHSLCLQGRTLWLGFGRDREGGLGALDLGTGKLRAFTTPLPPELTTAPNWDPANGPPRHAVNALIAGRPGELFLFVADRGFCRFRPEQNSWETAPLGGGVALHCLAPQTNALLGAFSVMQANITLKPEHSPEGTTPPAPVEREVSLEELAQLQADPAQRPRIRRIATGESPDKAELRLLAPGQERWQTLAEVPRLPATPEVFLLQGPDLWLGGSGYIMVFDTKENRVRSRASIPARSVDQLQVAGGYLWAKFDRHLYRTPLSSIR